MAIHSLIPTEISLYSQQETLDCSEYSLVELMNTDSIELVN